MPANAYKINKENSYYHVHNKGRDGRAIFSDESDFNTFITYLNEYLTHPSQIPVTKKVFTVQGKTYQGVPHLPKNYHNKVELVSYSLIPTGYNLIVKQIEKGFVAPDPSGASVDLVRYLSLEDFKRSAALIAKDGTFHFKSPSKRSRSTQRRKKGA